MMFRDRIDAGKQLAAALQKYKNSKDTVVLGLPRGGVVLAYEVSKDLQLPLDIICPRKIGAPGNPEFAIGAVTETGQHILDPANVSESGASHAYLLAQIEREKEIAQRRLSMFRQGRPPRVLKGKS